MARWAGVKEVVLRQQGYPPPNGLGAIRVIRSTGVVIEEEITAFEPPKRLGYQMAPGMLFRAYEAEVLLEPSARGTTVTWRARLEPRIPGTGWLLRGAAERALGDLLSRLTRYPFGL